MSCRFLGLCDAYVAMRLGFPEPRSKEFCTMVQYNKLNPTWHETFVFLIDKATAAHFARFGGPAYLYVVVRAAREGSGFRVQGSGFAACRATPKLRYRLLHVVSLPCIACRPARK